MSKVRINFGGLDWQLGMTIEELEKAYFDLSNTGEFLKLPLLLDGQPHSVIRVRPSQIRYYLEEL